MICRITGRVLDVQPAAVTLGVGPVCYEVLVPAASGAELQRCQGQEVTLYTLEYLEGNPAGGNLVPRLVGFLSPADREFFQLFTRVKGISTRRALRAMEAPVHQIAAAIEHADERALTALPEIGKRTAAQIVTELRGQMLPFLAPAAPLRPVAELTEEQRTAIEILVKWGDRRADAQRWVTAALEEEPVLTGVDALVRAAYRCKSRGG